MIEHDSQIKPDTASQKATAIIESIWSVWYGQHRGSMNPDSMGDLLEGAKAEIVRAIRESRAKWDDPSAAEHETTMLRGRLVEASDEVAALKAVIETVKSFAYPMRLSNGVCGAIVEFLEGNVP